MKELDLAEDNQGCYNGKWCGSGPVLTSYNPATGKPIARVQQASEEEYEACIAAMDAAQEKWANVRVLHLCSVKKADLYSSDASPSPW